MNDTTTHAQALASELFAYDQDAPTVPDGSTSALMARHANDGGTWFGDAEMRTFGTRMGEHHGPAFAFSNYTYDRTGRTYMVGVFYIDEHDRVRVVTTASGANDARQNGRYARELAQVLASGDVPHGSRAWGRAHLPCGHSEYRPGLNVTPDTCTTCTPTA